MRTKDYEDYEDSEFFDNPGKTQELDFHIMCLISGIYNWRQIYL